MKALAKYSHVWMILLSFIIALLLTTMPLPALINDWRPAWVAMLLIYWCIAAPERIGVGIAWLSGLILDVHTGALLGQNALGLSVIAYFTLRLHKQLRVFPPLQQSAVICVCLIMLQFFTLWIRGIAGIPPHHWTFWAPVASSMLLWPAFFYVMRAFRHRFDAI